MWFNGPAPESAQQQDLRSKAAAQRAKKKEEDAKVAQQLLREQQAHVDAFSRENAEIEKLIASRKDPGAGQRSGPSALLSQLSDADRDKYVSVYAEKTRHYLSVLGGAENGAPVYHDNEEARALLDKFAQARASLKASV